MITELNKTLNTKNIPFIVEIPYESPVSVFSLFSDEKWSMFLNSADGDRKDSYGTNRYSYIAIEPFKKIVLKARKFFIDNVIEEKSDPFMVLKDLASKYQLTHDSSLPPFQGGLMGFLSYDLCHYYENVPFSKCFDSDLEDMAVGFYDLVHAFDHKLKKSWVFSSGFPYEDYLSRKLHAKKRSEFYLERLKERYPASEKKKASISKNILANFTKPGYMEAVNKAIHYITEGDIFEVNLSQRFELDLPNDYNPFNLYLKISEINPSPFAAYINLGDTKIISSSPERFIKVDNSHVETRPIKGTRKRSKDPVEDALLAQDLINSEKDNAENIMIVDLMRNDLSHVCEEDSVTVPQLCGHEIYPNVHHLVSVIHGVLKPQYNIYDLLKYSFPGGSITGAPKIRAMQIISELEPHQRGPYCGSIFFASFDGLIMDSSILIRTYVMKGSTISFNGGGAVTIDSDPEAEYEETLSKVQALKNALEAD